MKKIIIYVFSAFLVLTATSCIKNEIDSLNRQLDELETGRIATVEKQMESAQTSVGELEKLESALTPLISALENEISRLVAAEEDYSEEIETLSVEISTLQILEMNLKEKVSALNDYVHSHIEHTGNWTETTFATLEQYDSMCSAVAAISVQMDGIKETMDEDAKKAIEDCVSVVEEGVERARVSMAKWINTKFDDYYTVDEMDEAVADALKRVAPADSVKKVALNDLAVSLDSAKVQMTRAYEGAIKDAIETAEGVITDSINVRIDAAKLALSARMDEIQPALDELTARIDAAVLQLVQYIQSIAVVPTYEDGTVSLNRKEGGWLTFDVSPEDAVRSLVDTVNARGEYGIFKFTVKEKKSEKKKKNVKAEVEPVVQGDTVRTFGVDSAAVDDEGHLRLYVDCSEIGDDFLSGLLWLSARLHVKVGSTDRMSEYFSFHVYPAAKGDIDVKSDEFYTLLQKMAQDPLRAPWFVTNLLSDECLGGGTVDRFEGVAISQLMSTDGDFFRKTWDDIFEGIALSNYVIASIDDVVWGSGEERDSHLGEAFFMRGLFTFWGSQLWGDIPAYWKVSGEDPSEPEVCPQQSADTLIYPHILADFWEASELLPNEYGNRVNKFVAEAMLGRAYLFYEGFYKNVGEMAATDPQPILFPSGYGVDAIGKGDVINKLTEVVYTAGLMLRPDYRGLWPYSNKYIWRQNNLSYYFIDDIKEENLWNGDRNGENIFVISFGPEAVVPSPDTYHNVASYYCSLCPGENEDGFYNGGTRTYPFAQGLGIGTVNPGLNERWKNAESGGSYADIRRMASILDMGEETKHPFIDSALEDGFYNKKWMEFTCAQSRFDYGFAKSYTWWGAARDFGGMPLPDMGHSALNDHYAGTVLMRYADVLMMLTEITGDAQYYNQVQKRAGVPQIGYDFDRMKNERLFEFAGEGIRYNDLRRWSGSKFFGDKTGGDTGCYAAGELQKYQDGVIVYHRGKPAILRHVRSSWAERYGATDGFLQIPQSVIDEVGDPDVLKQNPGWEDPNDWQMTEAPTYEVSE